MNTHPAPTRRVRFSALAFAALAFGFSLIASDAPPPNLIELIFVTVKPDKVNEYERLLKEESMPAMQKGGIQHRNVPAGAVQRSERFVMKFRPELSWNTKPKPTPSTQ